jgi:uncharacterized protein YrrD
MQNIPSSKKWSDIKGIAAVAIETGKKVGTVNDLYCDVNTGKVLGFRIKTGMFGHQTIAIEHIAGIGADALTFHNEEAMIKEQNNEVLNKATRGKDLLHYRILSKGGTVVGTVGNLLLETTTPTTTRLVGYALNGGLRERLTGHYAELSIEHVFSYGQDVLVIPDEIAQTLTR